jgi:hypothetical protein
MLIRCYKSSTYRLRLVLVVKGLGISYRTACCHMAHLSLEMVVARLRGRRAPRASTPRPVSFDIALGMHPWYSPRFVQYC